MKRMALCWLAGCLTVGTIACSSPSSAIASHSPPAAASHSASPSVVVTDYYRTIVARDYRQAFSYLAAQATGPSGRRLTLPAFLQLARMLDSEGGPVTGFTVGGFPSMIVMTIERRKYGPYHAHLRMAHGENGWVIISMDRI